MKLGFYPPKYSLFFRYKSDIYFKALENLSLLVKYRSFSFMILNMFESTDFPHLEKFLSKISTNM